MKLKPESRGNSDFTTKLINEADIILINNIYYMSRRTQVPTYTKSM